MKKRLYLLVVVALLVTLISPAATVSANTPIRVLVNGRQLTLDVPPILQGGRVLVPFRAIFEALGAEADWDAVTNQVTGRLGRSIVVLQPGQRGAWLNGAPTQLDVGPTIQSGRTLVPVRVVSEVLGATVDWQQATGTVVVTTPARPTPTTGGVLNRAVGIDADTLNPLFSNNNVSLYLNSVINLGLVRLNERNEPINSLAERWTWDVNTLTYRFWLAKDVKWHDGQPFTAHDVKFTFDTILNPASTNFRRGDFVALQSVTVIDDYTVDFKLSRIDAPFLSRMTMGIIPKHILGNVPMNEMQAHPYGRAPIGTGPFKLERWTPAQNISLVAHKDYHLEGPYLDGMLIRVIFDSDVMGLAWENGELDWITAVPTASINRVQTQFATRAYFREVERLEYEFLRPNMANPILQDVKVRQALMYALDRPAMVNSLLNGKGTVMHGHQLPTSWAYTTGLETYALNRTKAVELLTEAGWGTVGADGIRRNAAGQRLTFTLLTNTPHPLRADMAAYIQDSWRRIGVDLRVELLNFGVLLGAHLNQSRFDMVLIGPGMQADPDPFAYLHTSQGLVGGRMVGRNNGNWSNPTYDRLMEEARSTMDRAQRLSVYRALERMFNRDLPFLPLFSIRDVNAIYNRVQGIVWGQNGAIFPELVYLQR